MKPGLYRTQQGVMDAGDVYALAARRGTITDVLVGGNLGEWRRVVATLRNRAKLDGAKVTTRIERDPWTLEVVRRSATVHRPQAVAKPVPIRRADTAG